MQAVVLLKGGKEKKKKQKMLYTESSDPLLNSAVRSDQLLQETSGAENETGLLH